MKFKNVVKAVVFPHTAVFAVFTPISTALMIYSVLFSKSNSILSVISYALAAYTLTIWCFGIPNIISAVKNFKKENKYARLWLNDHRLRINISLYGSLTWNVTYAAFQLWLGFYHHSFWFYSLAIYYVSLAVMRFILAGYTTRHEAGYSMSSELARYRNCGWVLLIMNLALAVIIFFMVYFNRSFNHHEITTIAIATYTFITFSAAIVNIFKYRRYNSPVYSASKAVSLASASVSLLTVESTMLNTFDNGEMSAFGKKMMLGISGIVVVAFVALMAVYMIIKGTKGFKSIKNRRDYGK